MRELEILWDFKSYTRCFIITISLNFHFVLLLSLILEGKRQGICITLGQMGVSNYRFNKSCLRLLSTKEPSLPSLEHQHSHPSWLTTFLGTLPFWIISSTAQVQSCKFWFRWITSPELQSQQNQFPGISWSLKLPTEVLDAGQLVPGKFLGVLFSHYSEDHYSVFYNLESSLGVSPSDKMMFSCSYCCNSVIPYKVFSKLHCDWNKKKYKRKRQIDV